MATTVGRHRIISSTWIHNVSANDRRQLPLWAEGSNFEMFEAALAGDPTVQLRLRFHIDRIHDGYDHDSEKYELTQERRFLP